MDIYQRYGRALTRKARRMLMNQDDAHDVVQALFLDLLEKGQLDVDLPYLYKAVTNRCLSVIRDTNNRNRLLEIQVPSDRGTVRRSCAEVVVSLDILCKLTDQLDDRNMEILVYRYLDDMSQDEVAAAMGLSRKSIGKRLQKIRARVVELRRDTPHRERVAVSVRSEGADDGA